MPDTSSLIHQRIQRNALRHLILQQTKSTTWKNLQKFLKVSRIYFEVTGFQIMKEGTHAVEIREGKETERGGVCIEGVNGEIDPAVSGGGTKGRGVAPGNLESGLVNVNYRSLSLSLNADPILSSEGLCRRGTNDGEAGLVVQSSSSNSALRVRKAREIWRRENVGEAARCHYFVAHHRSFIEQLECTDFKGVDCTDL